MSSTETFNTRDLPVFPLSVVLFPGALMPLHIFEERYKKMINDCLAGEKIFGITYLAEDESWPPGIGRIGTIAQIMAVVPLDGGRMNILTVGIKRYRTLRYIEKETYLKAEVEIINDIPDDYDLVSLTEEVKKLYVRAAKALKELNDEQTLPTELPEEPEEFSFAIAAVLQMPLEKKQPLLELRSTGLRLTKLRQNLSTLIEEYENRAKLHTRAKSNGHGSPEVLKTLKEE